MPSIDQRLLASIELDATSRREPISNLVALPRVVERRRSHPVWSGLRPPAIRLPPRQR